MAGKTAARSVGPREPAAAVVPAAKVRVTVALPTAVVPAAKVRVTVAMPAAVAAMAPSMASAMTPSMASAALADRRTRQQRRQNKDRNSDCVFGHGTILANGLRKRA